MPQNPYPYTRITAEDFVPGVPDSGTDVNAIDHNKQGGAIAHLVNGLPVWKVDPDNTEDCYATINAAYAAADAGLSAGEPVIISVAAGKLHDVGTWNLDGTRDVYIIPSANSSSVSGEASEGIPVTEITGIVNLNAHTNSNRALFAVEGVDTFTGFTLTIGSKWKALFQNLCYRGAQITRTHGADGAALEFNKCTNNTTDLGVTDTDDISSGAGGIKFTDGYFLNFITSGARWTLGAGVSVVLQDCRYYLWGVSGTAFDFASKANTTLEMNNVIITAPVIAGALNLLANHANTTIRWRGVRIIQGSTYATILNGDVGTHDGAPKVVGDTAPVTPPTGTEWRDTELHDTLVWDGVDWGNGGVFRKDLSVGIGAAALDHDIGWNVPTGAAVVSTSIKLLKPLTGAAGAVQAGLGTGSGGDPDKYSETADLAADTKDQNLHGTFDDGGGDDLKITAETAPGTSGGTVAGSGSDDVRVLVRFRKADVLP